MTRRHMKLKVDCAISVSALVRFLWPFGFLLYHAVNYTLASQLVLIVDTLIVLFVYRVYPLLALKGAAAEMAEW